jgi:hypothetical protein
LADQQTAGQQPFGLCILAQIRVGLS